MATAVTPQQAEMHTAPVAEKSMRAEPRTISIDGSTLSMLAVGVALFALAFGAFTHLSGRIDGVATELRTEIKDVNAKVDKLSVDLNGKFDKLSAETNGKFDKLSAETKRYSERTDDKLDKLTDKLNALLINQSQGK